MAEKDDKKREPGSSEQKHEAARDQAEAEARAETHAVLHRGFTSAYGITLRSQNLKERMQGVLRRVLRRG